MCCFNDDGSDIALGHIDITQDTAVVKEGILRDPEFPSAVVTNQGNCPLSLCRKDN